MHLGIIILTKVWSNCMYEAHLNDDESGLCNSFKSNLKTVYTTELTESGPERTNVFVFLNYFL